MYSFFMHVFHTSRLHGLGKSLICSELCSNSWFIFQWTNLFTVQDLRRRQFCCWRFMSSWMLCRVDWQIEHFLLDHFTLNIVTVHPFEGRSQWPCGLRRGSAAARLLGSWVRIPPEAWMSVSCECCVLSGRGLCDELVPRPEESYRVWCVYQCDREAS
jgi:hypothetical protein